MKRLALLAVLVLTVVSCTKKETPPCPPNPAPAAGLAANPICEELSHLETEEEIKAWIDGHKEALCDGSLYECVINEHIIDFTTYYDFVRTKWHDGKPEFRTFKWDQVKLYLGTKCYPDYIGFEIDPATSKIIDFKTIPFTTSETVYSPPLFRAIDKKVGKLADDDVFTFVVGTVNSTDKVLFSVYCKATKTTMFFDISDNPTLLPDFFVHNLVKK
jgi:hypothetical protein